MSQDQQPQGFLNRSFVVLVLTFTIPALLTLAGTAYVATRGRIPGGVDSFCERTLNENIATRINIYDYQAGLVQFETQTFLVRENGGELRELFADTIPAPKPTTCETNIIELDTSIFLLQSQKTIAWSNDAGQSWQIQNVCDDPRPTNSRCDAETLNFADVLINADGTGQLTVQESIVDEFGEPQRDVDDDPIVANQWTIITTDAGQTWSLQSSE